MTRHERMRGAATPAGFTLVEMMVAVALVVLMMAMFASVFQIATGAMNKQKGLAENDQRARLVTTVLQSDLQKRTYRRVLAQYPSLDPLWPALQQGYLYISENDPYDDTDDVLQFTILTTNVQKNDDQSAFFGRTTPLKLASSSDSIETYLRNNPNQPEFDDQEVPDVTDTDNPAVPINRAGSSPVGEVSYFLRNGILYRRVMLVRVAAYGNTPTPTDASSGAPIIDNPYIPGPPAYTSSSYASGLFWRDFDYSAYNLRTFKDYTKPDGMGDFEYYPNIPVFHSAMSSGNALQNIFDPTANTNATRYIPVISLGMPNMRWGFNIQLGNATPGRPQEYSDSGTKFIGRFTHEETSSDAFQYPGTQTTTGTSSPFARTDLTLNSSGAVSQYTAHTTLPANGNRRGEDILLTNVHSFDVKVFDDHPSVMGFRDVGHTDFSGSTAIGYYHFLKCRNTTYGPRSRTDGADGKPGEKDVDDDKNGTPDNAEETGWPGTDDVTANVFDTWHPNFNSNNSDGANSPDLPPYLPLDDTSFGPDGNPGQPGYDDDGMNGADDGKNESTYWSPNNDDYRPMRAIQIHIRYLDTVSGQMRDLTLIQNLMD